MTAMSAPSRRCWLSGTRDDGLVERTVRGARVRLVSEWPLVRRPARSPELVTREVLTIAVAGILVALPAAWWLGRFVSTQLFGVEPTDVVTIGGAVMLLLTVALLAGLVPSARAARLNPTTALRHE